MSLDSILDAVAKGKLDPHSAKLQIKKMLEESPSEERDGLKGALDRLKKTVHIDELVKKGTGVVNQITENIPRPFEKIHLPHQLNNFAFSSQTRGVESKLSIFRAFQVSDDSTIAQNQVIGSQWFGVTVADTAEVQNNRFTAVQFSEVAIARSNFNANNISLSRLSNFTVQESKFDDNKVTRSTLSDVSVTEADYTLNKLTKSAFAQTVINSSRIANNSFFACDIRDCEFDSCDIQGIEFENCSFSECTFTHLRLVTLEKVVIRNQTLQGRTIHNCKTIEEFLTALSSPDEAASAPEAKAEAAVETQPSVAPTAASAEEALRAGASQARPKRAKAEQEASSPTP